jgi:hypothetical protein
MANRDCQRRPGRRCRLAALRGPSGEQGRTNPRRSHTTSARRPLPRRAPPEGARPGGGARGLIDSHVDVSLVPEHHRKTALPGPSTVVSTYPARVTIGPPSGGLRVGDQGHDADPPTRPGQVAYAGKCRPGIRPHTASRPTSPRMGDQAVPAGPIGAPHPTEDPCSGSKPRSPSGTPPHPLTTSPRASPQPDRRSASES